jgi:hypothetical protein
VKRSSDHCLSVLAKFAWSQFVFSTPYRGDCHKAIKEGKEQMENITLYFQILCEEILVVVSSNCCMIFMQSATYRCLIVQTVFDQYIN